MFTKNLNRTRAALKGYYNRHLSCRLGIGRLLDHLHETLQGMERIYETFSNLEVIHLRLDRLEVLLHGLVHPLVHHGAYLGTGRLLLPVQDARIQTELVQDGLHLHVGVVVHIFGHERASFVEEIHGGVLKFDGRLSAVGAFSIHGSCCTLSSVSILEPLLVLITFGVVAMMILLTMVFVVLRVVAIWIRVFVPSWT